MYKVGIINSGFLKDEISLYIESNKIEVENFTKKIVENNISEIEAFLLFTNNEDSAIAKTCQQILAIKSQTNSLIWVITKERSNQKNMIYLQLGADTTIDQYCTHKEFHFMLSNALERKKTYEQQFLPEKNKEKKSEKIKLNEKNLSLVEDEIEVNLTRIEYRLLKALMKHTKTTLSYETLYKEVWGNVTEEECKKYRVANIVFHIRKKFEQYSIDPKHVKTVRSVGYQFVD